MRILFLYFSLILSSSFCTGKHFRGYFKPYMNFKPILFLINPLQCEKNEECQDIIQNSICEQNKCICPSTKLESSDGTKCLDSVKEFGAPCDDNVQCSKLLLSGGACINNACKCKPGYHYLKGFCWKNSGLGSSCKQNEQCYSDYEYIGFECKNAACRCRQNYYERLGKSCRRSRSKGDSCNLNDDCRDANSKCQNRVCSGKTLNLYNDETSFYKNQLVRIKKVDGEGCPPGKFEMNGECFSELGEGCSRDEECSHLKGAVCLDKKYCACVPPTSVASENNRECLKVTLGQVDDISRSSCKEDSQCNVFGENSYCENKRCACKSGSYWENDYKYCWQFKSLGEKCIENRDCHPKERHTVCKENICDCQKGYHKKNGQCVPDAVKVGDSCTEDDECLFPNSYCEPETEKCVCQEYFNVVNGKCVVGVQGPCENGADCSHLNNTVCRKGNETSKQCLCLDNYVKSEDSKYCLPIAQYKENCTESFQCRSSLGELGECRNGVCQCDPTAHFSSGQCYKSKYLKEPCARRLDCFPGDDNNSVICLRGFCACNYDYSPVDNRICLFANSATIVKLKFYSVLLMVLPLVLVFGN